MDDAHDAEALSGWRVPEWFESVTLFGDLEGAEYGLRVSRLIAFARKERS